MQTNKKAEKEWEGKRDGGKNQKEGHTTLPNKDMRSESY